MSHTDKGSVMSERYVIDEYSDNGGRSERRIFGSIKTRMRSRSEKLRRRNHAYVTTELNGNQNKGTSPRCPTEKREQRNRHRVGR